MLHSVILLLICGFCSCSNEMTLLSGSILSLPCLDETPHDALSLNYTWWFSSSQNRDQDQEGFRILLDQSGPALSVGPVTLDDHGTIECVVEVSTGAEQRKLKRTFFITVRENPPVLMWTVIHQQEKKRVLLPCDPPKPLNRNDTQVKWFRQDGASYQEIQPVRKSTDTEGPAGRFYWAPGPRTLTWFLEITDLRSEDEGIYKCEILMGSKSINTVVELKVEKIPPPRCANQSQTWEACPDEEKDSSHIVVRESLSAFSVHLYRTLNRLQTSSNLLFSPVSIASLLSHLLLGSREGMRTHLEKVLSLPVSFPCTHSAMKKLIHQTKDSVLIANQMFYNPALNISQGFINQSQEFYNLVPEKLTNSSAANVKMINDWVADKTHNKIQELVDSVDESTEFILLNAVYFIGKWRGKFETQNQLFITLDGNLVNVPTLYSSNFNLAVKYQPQLKAMVARFSLEGKSSLYILVPNSEGKESLAEVENRLTENTMTDMVQEMKGVTPTMFEVSLPKVKLHLKTDLLNLLMKMGMSQSFSDPNLCGMFQQEQPVMLTDAHHRAFLSLTETGVEAAAASSISFSRSLNTFSAMQPFVFLVWSEQIRGPLFMGKVLQPEV